MKNQVMESFKDAGRLLLHQGLEKIQKKNILIFVASFTLDNILKAAPISG